jgi:hypothetical protein
MSAKTIAIGLTFYIASLAWALYMAHERGRRCGIEIGSKYAELGRPAPPQLDDSPEIEDTWYDTIASTCRRDLPFAADAKVAMEDGKITKKERDWLYARRTERNKDADKERLDVVKARIKDGTNDSP